MMLSALVYIAGFGRSGSTLIESMLRREADVLGIGEVFFIWDRGVLKNELVGNGVPFRDSPFWSRVLERAFGGVSEVKAREFDAVFQRFRGRMPHRGPIANRLPADLSAFAEIARPLYAAIAEEAQGRMIVDSSKFPLYAAGLARVLDKPPGVIHVFRDPRAVTHSWDKLKFRSESGEDGQKYMARSRNPISAIWRWKWFNVQARQLSDELGLESVLVGYEDFCADPDAYVRLIRERFGIAPKSMADVEWQSVSGNPARFDGSLERIKIDEAWRERMSLAQKILVGAACRGQHADLVKRDRAQFGSAHDERG